MALSLESIKGGGGSIKVGAVGKIGVLMTRELESAISITQKQSNLRLQTVSVSVPCGATPRRLQARRSMDEASSSSSKANFKKTNINLSPEVPRRSSKCYASSSSRPTPMLGSNNMYMDETLFREKITKKRPQMVDIVDIKCGDSRKSWVNNPVANRLKKLGFAKLSETTV